MSDERTPGQDETRPMPPVDDATRIERNQPSGGPRSDDRDGEIWSGRAEVRAPHPSRRDYYESDWTDSGPAEPQGRWWAPIAVGGAALVLLGLLGVGIAVIVQNTADTEAPAPVVTTTATTATTEPAAPGKTVPTREPTTTQPVITTTPTTEPAATELPVPALRGMPLADAQAALDRSGLTYRVIRRGSDAEPGTVIDSDPPEGRLVPSDTRITLIVAVAPTAGPTATTTAPAGEPPPGEPDQD